MPFKISSLTVSRPWKNKISIHQKYGNCKWKELKKSEERNGDIINIVFRTLGFSHSSSKYHRWKNSRFEQLKDFNTNQ